MRLLGCLFRLQTKKNIEGNPEEHNSYESDKARTLKAEDDPKWPQLFKFGLSFLVFVGLIGMGIIILYLHNRTDMTNEIESVLIAQPFTENNDFMFFHLQNKMRALLIRPNAGLNSTYICLLTSIDSGGWFCR